MERRSGEPHLVVRHLEHLAVQRRTQAAGVPVKRGHNPVFLHAQGVETVLLSGAGEIGAFRHHQAARFGAGHLKLLGDGGDGPVWSLSPYNHLGELSVDAVHKALLVGPAAVPESLAVRGPWPGEDLGDGPLIDGLHGPAHAQALLDLIGRVVKAPGVGLPGGPVYVVKLIGIEELCLLLELDFEGIQPGDVDPGAGVLQLFHPGPGEGVFLAVLDVFLHGPAKLRQLITVEQPLGICQGDVIVGGKAPVPCGHLALNLSLSGPELGIQVFHIGV